MEDPLNPLDSQDPFGGTDPLDDPLLDALEHSIEGPPGFVDPLAEHEELLMDGLAKQLDQVEASMENAPQMPPGFDEASDGNESNIQSEEPEDFETPMLPDGIETTEIDEIQGHGMLNGSGWPAAQDSSTSSSGIGRSIRELPSKGSGSARRRGGPPFKGHASGRRGRTGAHAGRNTRLCPENHEIVETQKCEECEKYRRWPEGTTEEHRECWYDWQLRSPGDGSNGDNPAEY